MKLTTGRLAIFGALVAAVLAAVAHVNYLKSLTQTQTVVVVTKEVSAFGQLTETNLALKEMQAAAVVDGALTSLDQAKGRYTRGLMLPGEVLRSAHLVDSARGSLAARLTATGDNSVRAMAVKVSTDTGVAATVQPGDKVDLLVAIKVDRGGSAAKIIAQGVPVLFTTFDKTDSPNAAGSKEGTVVLQVAPQVAEELAFAQTSGTIWLLTTPYTARTQETEGVNISTFQRKYPVAAPEIKKG